MLRGCRVRDRSQKVRHLVLSGGGVWLIGAVIVGLIGLPFVASGSEIGGTNNLPPIECVQTIRSARIEVGRTQSEKAWQFLESALEIENCELVALNELLRGVQLGFVPEHREKAVRGLLLANLRDSSVPIPDGLLRYLYHGTVSAETKEDLVGALIARLQPSTKEITDSIDGRVEILTVLGSLQEDLNQLEEARESFVRRLALQPSESHRWKVLELELELERWDDLLVRTETLLQGSDSIVYLERLRLVALAHLGRYEELLAGLDAMKPEPDRPEARVLTGDEMTVDLIDLLIRAAWALRDIGRDSEAEAIFRRVLAVDPDQSKAQLALLYLYGTKEERGSFESALAEERREQTDPVALFEEGSRLLVTGDVQTSYELLTRAVGDLEGTPFAEAGWYNLGIAAYRLEQWSDASRAFGRSAELEPGRAETFRQLGIAQFQLGNCSEAVTSLKRASELQPEKHQVFYYLAKCYETLGEPERAAEARQIYNRGSS